MTEFDHWLKRQGEQPEKERRRFLIEDFFEAAKHPSRSNWGG